MPTEAIEQVASFEAARSALDAHSDASLRVPCYCEENVWRLAFRKLAQYQKLHPDPAKENNDDATSFYAVFISNPKACVPMYQQLASKSRDKPVFWDYHVVLLQETKPAMLKESATEGRLAVNTSSHVDGMVVGDHDDGDRRNITSALIWDIDSHMLCPCPLNDYLKKVFPNDKSWPAEYTPYFRVVEAETYLRHFSSDRSHMYNDKTGEWNATPPPYDCIIQSSSDVDDVGQESFQEVGSSSSGNQQRSIGARCHNTLKRYMTISQIDIDEQKQRQSTNKNDAGGDIRSTSPAPYGRIYSLSELQKRFCPIG